MASPDEFPAEKGGLVQSNLTETRQTQRLK